MYNRHYQILVVEIIDCRKSEKVQYFILYFHAKLFAHFRIGIDYYTLLFEVVDEQVSV